MVTPSLGHARYFLFKFIYSVTVMYINNRIFYKKYLGSVSQWYEGNIMS